MKKVNLLTKIFLLGAFCISTNLSAQSLRVNQNLAPHTAMDIALHDLPNLLSMIEPEDMNAYGFSLTDNFAEVQVGLPFYAITLPRNLSTSSNETIELNPYTIMIPVTLNGISRCLIYVSPEEGQWKSVGIGGGYFVKNNQAIFNQTGGSNVVVSVPQQSQQYYMYNDRYQPMIAFEGMTMDAITLNELISINNENVPEAAGAGNVQLEIENTPKDQK